MSYSRRSLSIDDDVYEQSSKILKEEMNLTVSKYVEIQLRALVRSKSKTAKELYEGVVADLIGDMLEKKKQKR